MLALELLLVATLILINGLLSMSELAIVSARPARLKAMTERGVAGSRRALALHSDPGRFLSTVQIGITLVGVVAGALSGATLGARVDEQLSEMGLPDAAAEALAYGSVIGLITYLSVVAGELVPKQLALKNAEAVACRVAPLMMFLAKLASPMVWALNVSARYLLRLAGRDGEHASRVTDDEIRTLIAEAEMSGVIEASERAMISGVMRLGDRSSRAIMTPRINVDMIDLAQEPEAIRQRIAASTHSRLPAFEGSPDHVLGIVQVKDVLDAILSGAPLEVKALVRAAPVIPASADALAVLDALKQSEVHIGLVHDEYGNFAGVVTTADILEAIAGVFRSEHEDSEPALVRRADNSLLVSGSMPVDEFAETLGIAPPATREFHTVAGFVLDALGRIPATGDSFLHQGWLIEVADLDGRRVDKILATRVAPARRLG